MATGYLRPQNNNIYGVTYKNLMYKNPTDYWIHKLMGNRGRNPGMIPRRPGMFWGERNMPQTYVASNTSSSSYIQTGIHGLTAKQLIDKLSVY